MYAQGFRRYDGTDSGVPRERDNKSGQVKSSQVETTASSDASAVAREQNAPRSIRRAARPAESALLVYEPMLRPCMPSLRRWAPRRGSQYDVPATERMLRPPGDFRQSLGVHLSNGHGARPNHAGQTAHGVRFRPAQ